MLQFCLKIYYAKHIFVTPASINNKSEEASFALGPFG